MLHVPVGASVATMPRNWRLFFSLYIMNEWLNDVRACAFAVCAPVCVSEWVCVFDGALDHVSAVGSIWMVVLL